MRCQQSSLKVVTNWWFTPLLPAARRCSISDGAAKLVEQLDDAPFVGWITLFGDRLQINSFEQMRTYQEIIKNGIETVTWSNRRWPMDSSPQDIASMLKSRLTFKEAIESPDQSLMSRHRLKVAQREFYSTTGQLGSMNKTA